uniref:Uncharacterized protein n=1 Tax=Ananas comosus var. bracteatus TaxID=296719 RepID=A0A6V7PHN9_ANACO|nr:unnamed protein product [Ananas comosus var. bracteatus]
MSTSRREAIRAYGCGRYITRRLGEGVFAVLDVAPALDSLSRWRRPSVFQFVLGVGASVFDGTGSLDSDFERSMKPLLAGFGKEFSGSLTSGLGRFSDVSAGCSAAGGVRAARD